MSKLVKIPECMAPFEVIVNGKHYVYTAGTTQVVPDDVAVVIEHHEQMHKQQTAPAPPAGGVCLPKEIDLSKYGSSETDNISYAILLMFSQGGGSCQVSNIGSFWEDVKTDKPLVLRIVQYTFEFIVTGPIIYRNIKTKDVQQINFSVMLYDGDADSAYEIKVSINNVNGTEAFVVVKVS